MTTDEMKELWELNNDEYIRFERVEPKRHPRPDMNAFMLLHELCPGDSDMVAAASHDEIYLEPSLDDVAEIITGSQCIELIRCGVRIDEEVDGFAMFR